MSDGPPENPRQNDIWLDDDSGELKVYDGTAWVLYEDVPDNSLGPNAIFRGN